MSRSENNEIPNWLIRGGAYGWRIAVMGVGLYFFDKLLREFSAVVLPFLFSLALSSILHPVVVWLEKRGLPRPIGSAAAVGSATAIVFGSVTLVAGRIVAKAPEFEEQLRSGWGKLSRGIAGSLPGVPASDVRAYIADIVNQAGKRLDSATHDISSGASIITAVFVGLTLALVFSFFFLKDGPELIDRVLVPLDERRQAIAKRVMGATWTTVSAYMQGLSIVATAVATMVGIAMLLIGVPMVIPVVVLSFFGSFVPFAGSFIAISVAGLIALSDDGPTTALLMIGACLLIQFIEGNFLQPVVFGRAVKLHPTVVLGAVTAGAAVWGIAGAFLAVPVVASIFAASSELNRARFDLKAELPAIAPSPESESPLIETP